MLAGFRADVPEGWGMLVALWSLHLRTSHAQRTMYCCPVCLHDVTIVFAILKRLLCCSWWRVVLDEAQMVGTGLSSVATMARRLHSMHRWCVTGTPIGPGGLDDVQGLLQVLHHEPFQDKRMWKHCVADPYERGRSLSRAF